MNTIGIENNLDWPRIRHLFKIGLFAAIMVLAGDMLLGWGVTQKGMSGLDGYFSRYLSVSNTRIAWSALLGLIGIPIEGLSYFGIYRLMADKSTKYAHAYRAGIFGVLVFGALVHVMCCAAVYYFKSQYALNPQSAAEDTVRFAAAFLLPATGIFLVFFLILAGVQISAFSEEMTPYPKWCWVFSVLFGFILIAAMKITGNHAFTNAISTGWISLGNLWMFGGLLATGKTLSLGEQNAVLQEE